MSKYNKVKDCPIPLAKWLGLINSVPTGRGNYLRNWDLFLREAYFELTGEDINSILDLPPELDYGQREPMTHEQQESLVKSFDNATKKLKEETTRFPELYSYLFELENYPPPQNIYDEIRFTQEKRNYEKSAYLRFETFQQMQADIRKIAESCMSYAETGRFIDNDAVLERLGFKNKNKGYRSNFVIKDGVVDYESELINTTRGIPAERLKTCPICDDVYWAKKTNAKTCGKEKCVNDLQNKKKKEAKASERQRILNQDFSVKR